MDGLTQVDMILMRATEALWTHRVEPKLWAVVGAAMRGYGNTSLAAHEDGFAEWLEFRGGGVFNWVTLSWEFAGGQPDNPFELIEA